MTAPSRNPHDTARMSGGSSGGSGAAVGGALVPIALGSDTNGSIRVPASFCGVFGLKPTYGRLSRAGSFPFVSSLDHLGPLARCVADLALAYDAMQGADPPIRSAPIAPAEPATPTLNDGIAGLRIACAGGYFRARRLGRRRWRRSTASPRRWMPRARSSCPRRRARAPPPMSSPPARAPRCTCPGCARARTTSTRTCATG